MNFLRVFCCATVFSVFFASARAQEPQPAKLYERGVNAFFDGRAHEADTLLSEAIQWNSNDPRAYYFRAFSLLREGRLAEAQGDMLVGATLEVQSPQSHAVGSALERIQGCDRLMLEQFRSMRTPRRCNTGVSDRRSASTKDSSFHHKRFLRRDRRLLRRRTLPYSANTASYRWKNCFVRAVRKRSSNSRISNSPRHLRRDLLKKLRRRPHRPQTHSKTTRKNRRHRSLQSLLPSRPRFRPKQRPRQIRPLLRLQNRTRILSVNSLYFSCPFTPKIA